MSNILLQENLTKAIPKPTVGEFQIDIHISRVFGIETGVLHFVYADVAPLERKISIRKTF